MFNSDNMNPFKRVIHTAIRLLKNERGEIDGGGDGGGEGDGGDSDWRDNLAPEIKNHPALASFKNPYDVAKSYVEVQKLIGPEKIIMPSEDSDDEEWNKRVFNRLGRPEKPEGYTLPTDLEVPKELPVSEKLVQGFREQAHKLGILPKQFAGMYKWFMSEQISQFNEQNVAVKTQRDNAASALRTEWGAAFEQNVALGEKVLNTFGKDAVEDIKKAGLNNHPSFIKFLSKIGKAFSEDQLQGKPPELTKSPTEALAEISKMENDPNHPLFIATHPEHQAALEKRNMLYKMAYPEK